VPRRLPQPQSNTPGDAVEPGSPAFSDRVIDVTPTSASPRYLLALLAILSFAALLRSWELGRQSFWYDEVVTMRLARQSNPLALFRELGRIDATRAPLHPLLLQGWLHCFGPSESAARSLSVLFGVATVVAMAWVGRLAADARVGLWAAWLGATSPLLVQYSRETRMYSLLVLKTCIAWGLLLSFRHRANASRQVAFALVLIALAYTHPLGLLMILTLGWAYWQRRRDYQLKTKQWLVVQVVSAIAIAPWVGRYFDHPPEFLTGRLPLRFLFGLPIGFTGGNAWVLPVAAVLIPVGWIRFHVRLVATNGSGPANRFRAELVVPPTRTARPLLTWFLVPPCFLYFSSLIGPPIFGPARYTLFVGPAYLILLAGGLATVPKTVRFGIALGLALSAAAMMRQSVYAPDLKANWRAAGEAIRADNFPWPVIVISDNDQRNFEVHVAHYYLDPGTPIIAAENVRNDVTRRLIDDAPGLWLAVGTRNGRPIAPIPEPLESEYTLLRRIELPGLRLELRGRAHP
jgi:mannosyltransferase